MMRSVSFQKLRALIAGMKAQLTRRRDPHRVSLSYPASAEALAGMRVRASSLSRSLRPELWDEGDAVQTALVSLPNRPSACRARSARQFRPQAPILPRFKTPPEVPLTNKGSL